MKEQTLSSAERCPTLSVDSKPLGVLDIRDTLEVLFRAGRMSGGAATHHVDRLTHGLIGHLRRRPPVGWHAPPWSAT